MAMEIVTVIDEAHEGEIVSLAYCKARREIFSAADGDKVIKVSCSMSRTWLHAWSACHAYAWVHAAFSKHFRRSGTHARGS